MKALAALALAGALAAPALAQYKWTVPDGSTAYGDRPPAGARNVQKVGGGPATSVTDPLQGLPFELRRASQNFPVVLYTASPCSPCDAGRALLRERGVPFEERIVAAREDAVALQQLGLGTELPVLTVGRQTVRGFEPQTWGARLDESGYPAQSRLPRGWSNPPARPLVEPPPAPATPPSAEAPPPPPPAPTTRVGPARF